MLHTDNFCFLSKARENYTVRRVMLCIGYCEPYIKEEIKEDGCGPGSSVSISTGYGLDGPGIESDGGVQMCNWQETRPL
jgi:hypothetical protein